MQGSIQGLEHGRSGCLIPFDCDEFSRKALHTLLENVDEIRADLPQRVVQELIDEGLPVIDLDPNHKLTLALVALHEALEAGRVG